MKRSDQEKKESGYFDWERRALLELYREYRSVIERRRLGIRPAALELFDSETLWGRWDPATRTIALARRLVREHPWHHVLGVLRHEMAHQLVEEEGGEPEAGDPGQAPRNATGRPHGAKFRVACRRLGVPEQYRGASTCLQECGLDWRTEKRDEDSERLLEKVRKLLALATSSNEHESLLAMNKVRELYARYNLEQVAETASARFAHIVICHGKKRIEAHQRRIISLLVGHFFVQIVTFHQFDPGTGDYHRAIEIIGTRENALMAEYVYHFLLRQVDHLAGEMGKSMKRSVSRLERKSYQLGVLEGFREKLERSEGTVPERGRSAKAPSSPGPGAGTEEGLTVIGTALARFRSDPGLDRYLSEVYPRLRSSSAAAQWTDSRAFAAGQVAGRRLSLNKPIATHAGNLGRLLAGK